MAVKLISSSYLYTLLAIADLLLSGREGGGGVLVATATSFTLTNNCEQTVWPGILSNAGVSPLPTTGFTLHKGETKTITPPSNWAGRFWARTHCTTSTTNQFTCLTGDCGSGSVNCTSGATPPATLAEFTLDGNGGLDFYDVSLVDGYNLPMVVVPRGGSGGDNCTATGCVVDLNGSCPSDLRVTGGDSGESSVVACRSACEKYGKPEFCCSGAYGGPDTCKPSSYSTVFKKACPTAYSYAYDDKTSIFTCGGGADYTITFCPEPSTSQKAASSSSSPDDTTPDGGSSSSSSSTPSTNDVTGSSMVYMGALDVTGSNSGASRSRMHKWTKDNKMTSPLGIGFLLLLCHNFHFF